jgi:hypothetical protein
MPAYVVPFVLLSIFEGEPTGLDFSGIITALTSALSAQQLIGYLASIIGIGISLYVAYTVVRKAYKMFKGAVAGRGGSV